MTYESVVLLKSVMHEKVRDISLGVGLNGAKVNLTKACDENAMGSGYSDQNFESYITSIEGRGSGGNEYRELSHFYHPSPLHISQCSLSNKVLKTIHLIYTLTSTFPSTTRLLFYPPPPTKELL